MVDLSHGQFLLRGWHYNILTRLKDIAQNIDLNYPSSEVKNQLT